MNTESTKIYKEIFSDYAKNLPKNEATILAMHDVTLLEWKDLQRRQAMAKWLERDDEANAYDEKMVEKHHELIPLSNLLLMCDLSQARRENLSMTFEVALKICQEEFDAIVNREGIWAK